MKLVEHYIMRGTRRLVLIIVGFLIFIFASYSSQRYLTEAANGTLALDVVLDIVFYKVLIALEMLLPVGLYVSVGVTLGQMYTDSEITAISAAGGSPGRLYKAVLYLAILNRPDFPGECFICELRLPDHCFRWKHNELFLLLPEEYGPAFPAIVDCYTSPPT